jgi:small subunit ribosomal protein S18
MARNNDRDRGTRVIKDTRPRGKKKVCIFCQSHMEWVDYKDVNLLRRFMSDRGKIRARRVSGNCDQHQREVATAIKTARELALLPYTQRTVSERGPGRGGGAGGRPGGSRDRAAGAEETPLPDADVDVDVGLGTDGGLDLASSNGNGKSNGRGHEDVVPEVVGAEA